MEQITLDDKHIYRVNGIIKPGVTEILSATGLIDLWSIPVYALEAARKLGTAAHKMTALYDRGNLNEAILDPFLIPYLNAWKLFLKETDFKTLAVENRVFSKNFDYCGTLDRVGTIDGNLFMIDIKTSTGMYGTVEEQMSAYALAYEEMTGAKIFNMRAIQLRPDGTYRPHKYSKQQGKTNFISALNVFKRKRALGLLEGAEYEREIFNY